MDYQATERELTAAFELRRRPIAVTFKDTPPAGITKFAGTVPSGCSFWRIAAGGKTFYTVPSDHYNCAVGSHTHNIELPKERAAELEQTLSFLTEVRYIRMEEIPGFARLPKTPGVVVYAPLGEGAVVNTGCIGNRVYTDLGEDELYAAIRGSDVKRLADEAQTIADANRQLADYHRARRKELATQQAGR